MFDVPVLKEVQDTLVRVKVWIWMRVFWRGFWNTGAASFDLFDGHVEAVDGWVVGA